MAKETKNIDVVRKTIEAAMAQAEEDVRKRLLVRRLELARNGISSYQKGKYIDAVGHFTAYIKVVEEVKKCAEGGLSPSHFDIKNEMTELVMISGIYWDLVKLYDRTRSPEKEKEFFHYMDKYISFAKGMPYQVLCAESLRKYINTEKPMHKKEFSSAYRMLATTRCFIASSLVDVTLEDTLPQLQLFRDTVLRKSSYGRWFILEYYQKGPSIALKIDHLPFPIRKILGWSLDLLAHFLRQR